MENFRDIYMVVGATGGCGYHVVRELLNKEKRVRIVIRDYDKAKLLFNDIWDQLEGVYIVDFTKEYWKKELINAFKNTPTERVSFVISNLAANNDEDSKNIFLTNFEINRRLISYCRDKELKHFLFISSFLIEFPTHPIARFVNKIRTNALGMKNFVEISLKSSGMKYSIIRPGNLVGMENSLPTNFEIKQGDKNIGYTSRGTVGKVVAEFLETNINNVTFEILSNQNDLTLPFKNIILDYNFVPDKKTDLILYNHQGVQYIYKYHKYCFFTLISGIALKLLAYRIKRYKNKF